MMAWWLLLVVAVAAAQVTMMAEYSTDGNVTLSILNMTFRTVELRVTVLGCDYGYYPSGPACLECACETDSERIETFS